MSNQFKVYYTLSKTGERGSRVLTAETPNEATIKLRRRFEGQAIKIRKTKLRKA